MSYKQIQKLYDKIPAFHCKDGCTDCCGVIFFSASEWDQVTEKRQATSLDCPYIEKGKCGIYEQRPYICRLFGSTDHPTLSCHHGCKPDRPLTRKECNALTITYKQIMYEEAKQERDKSGVSRNR
jgi:Fe-S-cluster containining protein